MAIQLDQTLHPKEQSQLIGHQPQWEQLTSLFQAGKLAPAWLLCGEQGIGKATFAYQLAKSIFETNGLPNVARQVAAGSYPNLYVIEPGLNSKGLQAADISVDRIQGLRPFIQQSAAIPGWRVVIIDSADQLNRFAANALLKAIEEPPKQTIFLLVAHQVGRVLPTIRSRCSELSFQALADDQVAEGLGMSTDSLIAKLARGSIGRGAKLSEMKGDKLFADLTDAIVAAGQGHFQKAQAFAKGNSKLEVSQMQMLLDLWLWWVYRIATSVGTFQPLSEAEEKLIQTALAAKPHQHWVEVWERLNNLFIRSRATHLDKNHLMMSAFYIIENPRSGDSLLYGT